MSAEPATSAPSKRRSLFISACEHSADLHAARLLRRLRELAPDVEVWGGGGSNMADAGAEILHNCNELAILGAVEGLLLLPKMKRIRRAMVEEVGQRRPDLVLLVDFGGFHLALAKTLRKRFPDLPIYYFISPQVWGSRPWRIKTIARNISKMLVIFPFEETLYRDNGVAVRFVGHPLAQKLGREGSLPDRASFCERFGLHSDRSIIGVFPGSRRQEIRTHFPVVLDAVDRLLSVRSDIEVAISLANQELADSAAAEVDRLGYGRLLGKGLTLIPPGENYNLMSIADLLWAKSGTTTLEATLFGKPMIIFYRANWVNFLLFLLLKQVKFVGWPNLLAGREVVPELLQLDCRADELVKYTGDWLDVPALRKEIETTLLSLRDRLGEGDFADNAGEELAKVLCPTNATA